MSDLDLRVGQPRDRAVAHLRQIFDLCYRQFQPSPDDVAGGPGPTQRAAEDAVRTDPGARASAIRAAPASPS